MRLTGAICGTLQNEPRPETLHVPSAEGTRRQPRSVAPKLLFIRTIEASKWRSGLGPDCGSGWPALEDVKEKPEDNGFGDAG